MELTKNEMDKSISKSVDYNAFGEVEDRIAGFDVSATSERISELIKASGLDDKTISEQIRVTPQAVNRWRNKAAFVTVDNLYALSGVLGVSMDKFFVARKKKIVPLLIEAALFGGMTNTVILAYGNELIKLFQQ